jgi:hypothetical protein
LNCYGLGVDILNNKKAFPTFTGVSITPEALDLEFDKAYGTITYVRDDNLGNVGIGLIQFCILLDICTSSNKNLLEDIGSGEVGTDVFGLSELFLPKNEKEESLMLHLWRFVVERQSMGEKPTERQDFSLFPNDYERSYYKNLLTLTGGNVSEAARRAGLKDSALRKKLKSMGL